MAYLDVMFELNIIDSRGENGYKIPHMNKEQVKHKATLPMVLKVSNRFSSPHIGVDE